jgi:hypothetical protein
MAEPARKEYRALNGVVVRRNFGNLMGNYLLDLVFENTTETNVILIWDHYHNANNQQNRFRLQFNPFLSPLAGLGTFAGMSSSLSSKLNLTYIRWFYVEPPNIEANERGLSTVTVKLIGELNYST